DLLANREDALGKPVHRALIVATVVLQLHDSVEALCAVALTKEVVVELHGLRHVREPAPVHPCPQRRNDCIHDLATANPPGGLAAGKREPFPATVIALEVTPGVKRHEYPAPGERGNQLGRPFGADLVFPIYKPDLFGPGISHL